MLYLIGRDMHQLDAAWAHGASRRDRIVTEENREISTTELLDTKNIDHNQALGNS
jgi:hypothetical protein